MTKNDLIDVLKQSKLLKGLAPENFEIIYGIGKVVSVAKNNEIINEGDRNHSLFILIKGSVEVVLPKERGLRELARATKIRLSRLAPGDFIGEYSIIDKEPASASVIAMEPCELFKISRKDFDKILAESDRLAKNIYKNMLKVVIKRARESNKELDLCY